ncbi:MAG: hypothetical protein CMP10_21305 [Zetaproteobacteria bacterium]|nr:hypothetical protein [Pseudobdellovibrionaceae bacterium]
MDRRHFIKYGISGGVILTSKTCQCYPSASKLNDLLSIVPAEYQSYLSRYQSMKQQKYAVLTRLLEFLVKKIPSETTKLNKSLIHFLQLLERNKFKLPIFFGDKMRLYFALSKVFLASRLFRQKVLC